MFVHPLFNLRFGVPNCILYLISAKVCVRINKHTVHVFDDIVDNFISEINNGIEFSLIWLSALDYYRA